MPDLAPGVLLVAPPRDDTDGLFARTAILIVDREPNGITTGLAINKPLQDQRAMDASALVLRFIGDPNAPAYWGGPMGRDPAILAELTATDGLEWFHLPIEQRRPFPLPNVAVIAVAEHTDVFEDRIVRSRLYIGLCVWGRNQLEAEIARGDWLLSDATADDVFTPAPEALWQTLASRAQR